MPTNNHASIRHQALDRAFRSGRRYNVFELMQVADDALCRYTGSSVFNVDVARCALTDDKHIPGVSRKTIYGDLAELRNRYQAPLAKVWRPRANGHSEIAYYYSDTDFSINNLPLDEAQRAGIREMLTLMRQFSYLPQFQGLEDMIVHLEDTFKPGAGENAAPPAISIEHNPYLKGLEFFRPIYEAIVGHKPLKVHYRKYNEDDYDVVLHPYLLKQYNNRWYLFAYNATWQIHITWALDRFESLKEVDVPFVENRDIDLEEYFDDVIGVAIYRDRPVEAVKLRFNQTMLPYVLTNPLHPSQRCLDKAGGLIQIDVRRNFELINLILSYGENVEVLEPATLRDEIRLVLDKARRLYRR